MYAVDACLRAADVGRRSRRPADRGGDRRARTDRRRQPTSRAQGSRDYADHVRAAAALLTAFDITGRLPYAMLAEELMQRVGGVVSAGRDFAMRVRSGRACSAVWPRCTTTMSIVRRAVIAPNADYRADASRMLAPPCRRARARDDAPIYGLALQRTAGPEQRRISRHL